MSSIESGHSFDIQAELLRRLKLTLRSEFSEAEYSYHNLHHAVDVDIVSSKVLDLIKDVDNRLVSEKDELAREVAAYAHDIVNEYSGSLDGMRKRKKGFYQEDLSAELKEEGGIGNERKSVEKVIHMIDKVDPNRAVFKDPIIASIEESIAVTVPQADFNAKIPDEKWEELDPRAREYFNEKGEGLRIYQPHVKPENNVVAFSIALADLSSGGVMPVEDSLKRGDAEYRELKDKIIHLLQGGIKNLPNAEKEMIIKDMKGWLKTQVQFFTWRKIDTDHMINEHHFSTTKEKSDKIKQALLVPMMNRYDELITMAINRSKRFETKKTLVATDLNEELAELAAEFGYFEYPDSR